MWAGIDNALGLHVKLHIVMNVLIVKEISCKYSVAVELMRSYVICIIKHIIGISVL